MKVKIVNKSGFLDPTYATPQSAGADVVSTIDCVIDPGERKLIPTGLYVEIPKGFEIQVRPRSGLAIKHGLTVLNTPGTIDADYRGEIGIIIINHGSESHKIKRGDRIAQLVLARYEQCEFENVDELNETVRGNGGFGHSGV